MKTSNAPKGKLLGVGVYILNEDGTRVLLTQRGPKARHGHYKWEGPGGALEPGETYEQAAHREILEELGIEITLGPKIGEFKGIVDPNGTILDSEIFTATTTDTPLIQEPDKMVGLGWFTREEAIHLELADYAYNDLKAMGWLE